MNSNSSPLTPFMSNIKTWVEEGLTNAQIVLKLRETCGITTTESSVRRAKKRVSVGLDDAAPEPSFTQSGDKIVIQGGLKEGVVTPEDLMEEYKVSSEDYEVKDYTLNRRTVVKTYKDQNVIIPLHQLKVTLRKKIKVDFLRVPTLASEYKAPKFKTAKKSANTPQMWIVAGDEQGTHVHEQLHQKLCEFIHHFKPHGMVNTGDLTDQSTISRHKANPEWDVALNEDLQAGVNSLQGYRMAHEEMEMHFLAGNHDIRIKSLIVERAAGLYGVKPGKLLHEADDEQLEALHLRNLIRLDDLNINYVDAGGNYEHAQFKLGPHVAVVHGSKTGPAAALKSIDRMTFSVIQGHTHHQSIQNKTIYDIDGNHRIITGVETGAMCNFNSKKGTGLGYTVKPDWVNGFTVVTLWDDGSHHISNAQFDGKHLKWDRIRF